MSYRLSRAQRNVALKAIRQGLSWMSAMELVGIPARTARRWRAQGEAGVEPYARLWEQARQVETEYLLEQLERVNKAADAGIWTAAAWNAERRRPHEFGLVAGLRAQVDAEASPTSQAARLATLAQHWGATHPADAAPELAAGLEESAATDEIEADE